MNVREVYPQDKLYVLIDDFNGNPMNMELKLVKGTIIGVIKEADPMGNKERFLVDTGCEFISTSLQRLY